MKRNILAVLSALSVAVTIGLATPTAQAQRGGATTVLDPVAKEALITALMGPEGEYAARAEYKAILAQYPGAQPFANILLAEEKHVAALEQQCAKYGVPFSDPYVVENIKVPGSLHEAAVIGVAAEIANVEMYDDLLSKVQNYPSLVQVFTNLRAASLDNHLPAFEAAVEYYPEP